MTVAACLAVLGYRFARLPGWRDQRWFWLIAASASLYTAFNVVVTLDMPEWVVQLCAHGNWTSLALHVIAWNLHSAAHFHARSTRLERAFIVLVSIVAVLALLPNVLLGSGVLTHYFLGVPYHEPPTTIVGSLAALPLYAALLIPLARFLRDARQNQDARRYASGLLILAGTGLNDLLASTGRYSLPYLLDLGFLLMVGLVWTALMDRFT